MTELLVATKKGLFTFEPEGEPGAGGPAVPVRDFAGDPVDYAMRDPHSGRLLASVTSPFYGPKIYFADEAGGEWTQAEGVALPKGEDAALVRVWTIVAGAGDGKLYAGGDPGVLLESGDGGESWMINQALWNEPSRPDWTPGGGGLCIHSILPWPGDPERLALGISAAGVWLTDDGGASWRRGNAGLSARYVPEEMAEVTNDLCIHAMARAPGRPERLFMQFHGGVGGSLARGARHGARRGLRASRGCHSRPRRPTGPGALGGVGRHRPRVGVGAERPRACRSALRRGLADRQPRADAAA